MTANVYEQDLDKCTANYTPLSPLSFIARAASVYPQRIAVVHQGRSRTWGETFRRCRQLNSALRKRGFGLGDTIAVVATNIPAFYEALFGIPAAGAVINPINIRLDADAIAFILDHGNAKAVLIDTEFAPVMREALQKCTVKPLVIDIADADAACHDRLGTLEYEDLLAEGDADSPWELPRDEW